MKCAELLQWGFKEMFNIASAEMGLKIGKEHLFFFCDYSKQGWHQLMLKTLRLAGMMCFPWGFSIGRRKRCQLACASWFWVVDQTWVKNNFLRALQ
ncbi:hypothetical protein SLA2020_278600 [Shorea laevis]